MSDSLIKFSTGRDNKVVVISPYGRLDLGSVTEFDAKQDIEKVTSKPMNGTKRELHLPDGWQGSFKVDRDSPALDDLAAAIESDWFDAGVMRSSTIYQYIRERDGSTSTYVFENASLSVTETGSWKSNSTVGQTLTFFAPRRKRV